MHRRRLAAWVAVVLVLAIVGYAARFTAAGGLQRDVFFRPSTAIATFALDGILLLLMLLIVRGLPLRDALALRRPASWRAAANIALAALVATWATSLALELTVGHEVREQAVPQYYDPARLGAFIANIAAVGLFVPIVEEVMCRGVGFHLLEPWGQGVAIAGTTVAFALAHGAVLDLPWVLVTGLGLGWLRSRTASLYPCVALHAAVNSIAIVLSAVMATPV
ncbi:MAG TPA: CPBP family intramembrane glutamic endopeptidase [Candidatus Limnocylindria bacterium]|nr:CPBP family intramembrane glutamic endopeptidase [Candidatus Limnocylindria bacterium]